MRILIGIMIGVMAIMMMASLISPMNSLMDDNKGQDVFNCNGYVDPTGVNSYNSTLNTNTFGCAVTGFGIPMFILALLIGIIMFALYGEPKAEEYNPYAQ